MKIEKLSMDGPSKKQLAALKEAIDGRFLPPRDFLDRAVEAGQVAVRQRQILEQLRSARKPLRYEILLSDYVRSLANAAGVSFADAKFALGVSEEASEEGLDTVCVETSRATSLLGLSATEAKYMMRAACISPKLLAASGDKGSDVYPCDEIQGHIDAVIKSGKEPERTRLQECEARISNCFRLGE